MRRDYGGQTEKLWHMLDEPCDYGATASVAPLAPGLRVLGTRGTSPAQASTILEYVIPKAAEMSLEVLNARGDSLRVLVQGRAAAGTHAAVWQHDGVQPGSYALRLRIDGHDEVVRVRLA